MSNMTEAPPTNVQWTTPDEELEALAELWSSDEFAEEREQEWREYWEHVRRAGRPVPEEATARYLT